VIGTAVGSVEFGDEGLIGARIVTPALHNGDRAIFLMDSCSAPTPQRPPIWGTGVHPASWPNPDPSRSAVEHGSDDFARCAWNVPVGLPDSAAELLFAVRGGNLLRMFRSSRCGLDRTADKQGLGSGNARTGTSCYLPHLHMRPHILDASNSRHLSTYRTMLSVPSVASRGEFGCIGRVKCPTDVARSASVCGYVDNASALPTYPQQAATADSFNSMI
jgi:hypothetical protein